MRRIAHLDRALTKGLSCLIHALNKWKTRYKKYLPDWGLVAEAAAAAAKTLPEESSKLMSK